jgi:ATP-dependent protease ClpP protease subunit
MITVMSKSKKRSRQEFDNDDQIKAFKRFNVICEQLKKKSKIDEDHEDENSNGSEGVPNLLSLFGNAPKRVYCHDNQIYFTSPVNNQSVNELGQMLNKINDHYDMIAHLSGKIGEFKPKPIILNICSGGGSLIQGFRAMDQIINSKYDVHTVVDGCAASAATMMAIVGKKRYMTKNSYMLIHQLSGSAEGNFEQLSDSFENDKTFMERIVNIYLEKCDGKMKKKEIKDALKHDLFWSAEECIKRGLVDEIYNPNNK